MFALIEEKLFGPLHAYVAPAPASVAVKFNVEDSQTLFAPVIAATGNDLTDTIELVFDTQPSFVTTRL